ncbi:MAG: TldD/PmbA family protein [Clostridiaceae bacterium]|jgi:PmbA protein|nr:TldD/PmbA family protein [Clostridiaceae bacterium]
MKSNKDIASYALDALRKAGADHAQCIVTSGKLDELNVDGGKFSLLRTLFTSSISLKALKDGRKGTITVNNLDKDTVDRAVAECIEAAKASVPDEAEAISEKINNEDFQTGVLTPDRDRLFDRLQEFLDDIGKNYPKVMIEQLISSYSKTETLLMNTNGVEFSNTSGKYNLGILFSSHENEKTSSFMAYDFDFADLDRKLIDFGMMNTLFQESEKQINTKPLSGKFTGKVLITPACLDSVLMMAVGNFMSDITIIDGTSPWISKLGKQVASSSLSLSTIPLDGRIVAGERFTGDGYKSGNMELITDGVLRNFVLSNYGSRKTGFPRALNLSQNYCVKPGNTSLNELIAGIDRGIVINRFSGGVPGTNGDFSGVAKNSFLVENGRITDALSETMISGNLIDVLNNITGISSETICDGKSVLPWMLCDGVTISGKQQPGN